MTSKEHNEEIKKELEKFTSQGFKCLPIGMEGFPRPDIVAIKDGEIYAVEVQLRTPRQEKYVKYERAEGFDDIIWIIKRKY